MQALGSVVRFGVSAISWGARVAVTGVTALNARGIIWGRNADKTLGTAFEAQIHKEIDDQTLTARLDHLAEHLLHIPSKVAYEKYCEGNAGRIAWGFDFVYTTSVTGSSLRSSKQPRIVLPEPNFFRYAKALYSLSCDYPAIKEGLKLATVAYTALFPGSLTDKAVVSAIYLIMTEIFSKKVERDSNAFALKHATPADLAEHIRHLYHVLYRIWRNTQRPEADLFERAMSYIHFGRPQPVKAEMQFLISEYEKTVQDKTCTVSVGREYFYRHNGDEFVQRILQQVKKHPAMYPRIVGFNGIYMDHANNDYNFYFTFPGLQALPFFSSVSREKIRRFLDEPVSRVELLGELIDDALRGPRVQIRYIADKEEEKKLGNLGGKKMSVPRLCTRLSNAPMPEFATGNEGEDAFYVIPEDPKDSAHFKEFVLRDTLT